MAMPVVFLVTIGVHLLSPTVPRTNYEYPIPSGLIKTILISIEHFLVLGRFESGG